MDQRTMDSAWMYARNAQLSRFADTLGKICKASAIACAALTASVSLAAPFVFEETAKIPSPDPTYFFPRDVAVEGDTIIATGVKFVDEIETHTAFLFRRQPNGTWSFVRALASGGCNSGEVAEDTCDGSVAIRNGLAVVVVGTVHVYLRQPDGSWTEAPSNGTAGPGPAAVGTNTVIASESVECDFATRAFRRNSAGVWSLAATLPGVSIPGCDDWGMTGSSVDMSAGNRIIVGTEDGAPVRLYEPSGSSWGPPIELTSLTEPFGGAVAMDDNRAVLSGWSEASLRVFNRNSGAWSHTTDIVMPDGDQLHGGVPDVSDFVFAAFNSDPNRGGSIAVFKEVTAGDYRQVARLVRSDGAYRRSWLGYPYDGWSNGTFARVVAGDSGTDGGLYVFDVNEWGTTPSPWQYDFESGDAGSWSPIAGSSFAVVSSSSGSKVYRQSATTGDAGAYVVHIDWKNQAIEADVKPTAFNGSDRWVGLALRRTDASNYYYVTLRQSNVLEIKRRVNGAVVTLASVPQQVVLNRNYHLRFEAIGTLLRVYLNGALAAQVNDSSLTHGSPGVQMYKTKADYDNIVLSQNPQLTLMDQNLSFRYFSVRFTLGPGTWIDDTSTGKHVGLQTSTAGDARAVNRIVTGDQIVQARVSPTQFAAGTGSRWFGLVARYVDASNYYYVTLRSDNTISLRKLVNGTIHVLDSAPLSVSVGGSYLVRLEAVGAQLRVYVNGNFLLEAKDSTHARGKYGPAMYKAAASYQDFLAWEP